jgi:hypothetical protein
VLYAFHEARQSLLGERVMQGSFQSAATITDPAWLVICSQEG